MYLDLFSYKFLDRLNYNFWRGAPFGGLLPADGVGSQFVIQMENAATCRLARIPTLQSQCSLSIAQSLSDQMTGVDLYSSGVLRSASKAPSRLPALCQFTVCTEREPRLFALIYNHIAHLSHPARASPDRIVLCNNAALCLHCRLRISKFAFQQT